YLERAVDLSQREVVPSPVRVNHCEHAIRAGRCGIERKRFLGERLGLFELSLAKFGPSRDDGLEMRSAQRCVGGGVVRVEVDRALEQCGRLVVLLARRMRHELATAENVFVSGEALGWFGEGAISLEASEFYRGGADNASGDVVLHGEDVLDL